MRSQSGFPQYFVKEQLLLRFVGYGTNCGDDAQMVLRDLADGGVRGGDDFDYLGQCGVRDFWSAELLRNVNRPKAALRKRIELFNWPDSCLDRVRQTP